MGRIGRRLLIVSHSKARGTYHLPSPDWPFELLAGAFALTLVAPFLRVLQPQTPRSHLLCNIHSHNRK